MMVLIQGHRNSLSETDFFGLKIIFRTELVQLTIQGLYWINPHFELKLNLELENRLTRLTFICTDICN